MLYLFNSGYYDLHRTNLLGTLFLPAGARNTYRYSRQHLPEELWSAGRDMKRGTECLIVFVDRYGVAGYEYLPIRRGRVVSVKKDVDHLFFDVVLDGFVFPTDAVGFQPVFLKALSDHQLPSAAPEGEPQTSDNHYAIQAADSSVLSSVLVSGDDAWANAADDLATRSAFKQGQKEVVFVRAIVTASGQEVKPHAIWRRDAGVFHLASGADYCLELTYRHPGHTSADVAQVAIGSTDNVKWGDLRPLSIGSFTDAVGRWFTPANQPEHSLGSLYLSDASDSLLVPTVPIPVAIGEGGVFWLLVAVMLIIYAGSEYIGGAAGTSLALLSSILKTGALFALFVLFGRKPL